MTLTTGVAEPTGRAVPPSMIAIAVLLFGGFLAVSAVMALTVLDGRGAAPLPDASDLRLPSGVTVVESHATCRAEACDGQGVVLHWDPIMPGIPIEMLAGHLVANGWVEEGRCATGTRCLSSGDLRVTMKPWQDVDPTVGAVMRASIRDRGLDDFDFVYLKVYRCGILDACE